MKALYTIVPFLFMSLASLSSLQADDDILFTEDFFERPATKEERATGRINDGLEEIFGDSPDEERSAPSVSLFKKHDFTGAIGISNGHFSLMGQVRSFFSDVMLWENTVFYRRESGEFASKDYSLEFYGLDSLFMVQYRIAKIVTPFVGVGPGFEMWSQMWDEYEFDGSNSVNALLHVGMNIHMTKNLSLQLRHVTKNYLLNQPKLLKNQTQKGPATVSYLQVFFMISI